MSRCGHEDSSAEGCHDQPLVTNDVTAQTSITMNELAKLQQEDTTLEKYMDLKDAVRKGDYEIK